MLGGLVDVFVWFFAVIYRILKVIAETIRDHEFRTLGLLVVVMLVLGTVFYSEVEGWRYVDSLYFSVTTLTTVGYGDLAPKTDVGKMFTMGYILVGIGVLLSFVNVIAHHALKNRISVRLDSGFSRLKVPRPRRMSHRKEPKYRYKAR